MSVVEQCVASPSRLRRDRADRRRLTSYGADLDGRPRLGALVAASCARSRSCRGCASPRSIPSRPNAALMRALAEEERLMPHLHLSLQSGDDLILSA